MGPITFPSSGGVVILVVNSGSIYLRLRTFLVAGILALVAVDSAEAQDARAPEEATRTGEPGVAEPMTETQDASEEDAAATSGDNPDKLPPIEVTQPAVKEPAQSETAEVSAPQIAAVRPAPSRSTSYSGSGGTEGLAGLGERRARYRKRHRRVRLGSGRRLRRHANRLRHEDGYADHRSSSVRLGDHR